LPFDQEAAKDNKSMPNGCYSENSVEDVCPGCSRNFKNTPPAHNINSKTDEAIINLLPV
jgi:hypothetical protein